MSRTRYGTIFMAILLSATQFAAAQNPNASTATPPSSNQEQEEVQLSVAGDGVQYLPVDSSGDVAPVAYSVPDQYGRMELVVRNDSSDVVNSVELKLEARDSAGTLLAVATVSSSSIQPRTLEPGNIGVGYAYLEGMFDSTTEYAIKVISFESGFDDRYVNIEFREVNWIDGSVVGEFSNPSSRPLESVDIEVVCFDSSGNLIEGTSDWISEPKAPGEPITFQVQVTRDSKCNSYIIGGSGR